MAIIYKIDPYALKLTQVIHINKSFELFGVISITPYEQVFQSDLEVLKYGYTSFDTFHNPTGVVDSDIHYHDDEELRFIMQGRATFYIYHDNSLYIADCNELELIKLHPNVIHWFTSSGELLVYRFFKDNDSRIAYGPDYVPSCLINAKTYIDQYGRKFEI